MKKTISLLLILAILAICGTFYASATNDAKDTKLPSVNVEYLPLNAVDSTAPQCIISTDTGMGNGIRVYPVVDLGTNNAASLTWTIAGKSSIRSSNNYKTGTGNIVLRVSGSPTVSINFRLFSSTDTLIAEHTVQVTSTTVVKITFSNLFTNKEYYIVAENVSQGSTTVTGTIASQ